MWFRQHSNLDSNSDTTLVYLLISHSSCCCCWMLNDKLQLQRRVYVSEWKVPVHLGGPRQRAARRVWVCVRACVCVCYRDEFTWANGRLPAHATDLRHRRLSRPASTGISTNSGRRNLIIMGPTYKISHGLSCDYLEFVVRLINDSDLQRAKIFLRIW